MPAPLPDPADSATRSARTVPSTQTAPADTDQTGSHVLTPDTEPPTVISTNKPRTAPMDPRLGEALAGRKLGHFELIESVGAGGMAAVIKARDLDLGRIVALKILPPDMAADPENIVRFKQEARAAAKLDHDNVARVYFFGEDQGLHFIAFEYVEGDNLRQLMDANGGAIPVPEAVALMLQVTAGLAHASTRGVVHRDIKPSNIIVTPDGRAKIVDMGLARSLDARQSGQLTQSGVTLGTFDYISPEQAIDPRSADVRSDIYSLGCTFYHALTAHIPVPEGTAAKKLDAQKHILPPDPRLFNPAIPAELAVVLGKMMAKDPDRRYQHPDHLAAHIRGVARKMGVPLGAVPAVGVAIEDPIPPPPRMSGAWFGTAVAVMVLALVVFLNSIPRGPQTAGTGLPDGKGHTAIGTDPVNDPPPVVHKSGPVEARTVDEFVTHLKQNARHIRLTGDKYDLTGTRDGGPIVAAFTGDSVQIDGVNSPTVKLAYADILKDRPASLTLQGKGTGKAAINGIRFLFLTSSDEKRNAGVVVSGFQHVDIEACTFAVERVSSREAQSAALMVDLGDGETATINQCYFAPACGGIQIDGPGAVRVADCAFAPQPRAIRVTSSGESDGATKLTLDHCSAIMTAGAVVEIYDGVACKVEAGHCLFTSPKSKTRQAFGPAFPGDAPVSVVRQDGRLMAFGTSYGPLAGRRGTPAPNGYHNVEAFEQEAESYSFAETRAKGIPINDRDRDIGHPWEEREPLTLLEERGADKARPELAFRPNLRLAALRDPDNRTEVLGARYVARTLLYPSPPPAPDDSSSRPPNATVKVWDPKAKVVDPVANTYPTLAQAVAACGKGDRIKVRHTGLLEIEPRELGGGDTDLTIQPDDGFKPVLAPKSHDVRWPAMFRLYGGRLVLDGLQFKFPGGVDQAPSIVAMPGGGQLEIRNAVITFETSDGSAVVLPNAKDEMMMGKGGPERAPQVTLENVFLRGRGRLLAVKRSKAFSLVVKNALAALDNSLIEVEPATADGPNAGTGTASVRLSRVTTYLSGSVVHLKADDRKGVMSPAGLVRTDVTAQQCVFVPASGSAESLVRLDRVDTEDQIDRVFSWQGTDNVYGYDKQKTILDYRPNDDDMMNVRPIHGSRWLARTQEVGDPFSKVLFSSGLGLPAVGERRFVNVRQSDLIVRGFEPSRPGTPPDEVGAKDKLPDPGNE